MPKFSVKKPFTVLVGVIIAVVIGIVSLFKMPLDLLPEINLPYLLVITTYPGASPEKVEEDVCKPMESALGTVTGVENVYGICNENYAMVELEFQDGTNLDSAMVKVTSALNTLQASLPEDCGTPSVIEIGTDLMASEYLAVSMEGMSIEELTQFVKDEITPTYERQEGVASVSELGLVEKSIQVELNEEKVRVLNDKILASLDSSFADALEQLDDAKKQLNDSTKTLQESKDKLIDSQADLNESRQDLIDGQAELNTKKGELAQSEIDLEESKDEINDSIDALNKGKKDGNSMLAEYSLKMDQLSQYNSGLLQQIAAIETPYQTAKAEKDAAQSAYDSALADYNEKKAASDSDPTNDALQAAKSQAETEKNNAATALSDKQAAFTSAEATYNTASGQLAALKAEVAQNEAAYKDFERLKLEKSEDIASADAQLSIAKTQLDSADEQIASGQKSIDDAQEQIDDGWESLADGQKQIDDGWEDLADGQKQLNDGWEDYYDGVKTYEKQRAEAEKKANADDLLKLETLAQLIYAQNFEMPAGYVDDELDNSWLIKVGQNYEEVDELSDIVLCNIHYVGDVKLGDVADITVIDNAEDSYVRLDGEQGIMLSIFKSSTAGTNEVTKVLNETSEKLMEKYPGLNVMVMMDQGEYIDIIVKSVLNSMLIGALLAIIVLAFFLRDVNPTLVVAISIPLSVLAALICMYFSGISLNMLSLSGLALGIGMLVDNSIVVMENIYRLRGRGIEAPRAAVQGTKQVAGAIISSTLTTVCVFLPMVYSTGLVRELMIPMCLTIVFCLMASLFVAMTVVPAASSTLLRNAKPKNHKWFDRIQDAYGRALAVCLKHKWAPILTAVGLLILTGFLVIRMGIVVMPDMTMNQIEATIEYPEDYDRDKCYELTDEAIERLLKVEGLGSVGILGGDETTIIANDAGAANFNFRHMSLMARTSDENAGSDEIKKILSDMEEAVADMGIDFEISTASSEMDSMMGGSGLSINVSGSDLDELTRISEDLMDIIDSVEGYSNISNGSEDADKVLHLVIDKNKAMSMGLSVAQIYSELADKIDNTADSVTVTMDNIDMMIKVVDNIDPFTRENIMDYTFTVDAYDEDDDQITEDHKLSEFATVEINDGISTINRLNQTRYITITASVDEGYNITLLTRELMPMLEAYDMPDGYRLDLGGEYDSVMSMLSQMLLVAGLGLLLIYLVMVAQFQSLLSPFIVLFTIPLAFTGGFLALWLTGSNLSIIGIMGFIVLMGTVVNNGIVFVDYTNQLRIGGMDRHEALIATGKTRMRPILMTALTTILAECKLIFGDDMGAQLGGGMALVIAGGLMYATLMTLFIIPVMYDILFKRQPTNVDIGSEDLEQELDDAGEFLKERKTEV